MELQLSQIQKEFLHSLARNMTKEEVLENFITLAMFLGLAPSSNIHNADGVNSEPVDPEGKYK